MNCTVDIQCATSDTVPDKRDLQRWVDAALAHSRAQTDCEISVRLVDTPEMSDLNATYRGKSGPTNVLSFPAELPPEVEVPLLGDIVICAPVVRAEALQQGKTLGAHWAHMAVHGTLHLLGYDHVEETEATVMESLETEILARLDYACPYTEKNPTVPIGDPLRP